MKFYTKEDKLKLIEQVVQDRINGIPIKQACEKAGVTEVLYYSWRRRFFPKGQNQATKPQRNVPTLMTLPVGSLGSSEGKLMVLVGSPQDIHQTLDKLIALNRV